MKELVVLIIGGVITLVGVALTLRYRPNHLLCLEKFRSALGFDIPEGMMEFNGAVVSNLSIISLEFQNTGPKVMCEPKATIRTDEGTRILAALLAFAYPPAQAPQSPQFKDNVLELSLPPLNPYAQDRDSASLTIFADRPIIALAAEGRGKLDGDLAWSVRFRPVSAETERRFRIATRLNKLVLPYLAFCAVYLLLLHPIAPAFHLDTTFLGQWASHPVLWFLAACGIVWFAWIAFLLYKGHYAYLPLFVRGAELRFYFHRDNPTRKGTAGRVTRRGC